MRRPLVALLVVSMTLSACGAIRESRINPFNWFGGSREVPADVDPAATGEANPLIPQRRASLFRRDENIYLGRPLDQVTELRIERVADGAIIRVEGIAQRADAYDIRLVPKATDRQGELHFELLGEFPQVTSSTVRLPRPVVVATHLSDQELEGIRRIRVSAARNARESRR